VFTAWIATGDAEAHSPWSHPDSSLDVRVAADSRGCAAGGSRAGRVPVPAPPVAAEGTITLDVCRARVRLDLVAGPLTNYTNIYVSYNSWLINLGSWGSQIPGWNSPAATATRSRSSWCPSGYLAFLLMVARSATVRSWTGAKRRWPATGTFGLMMVSSPPAFVLDVVCEIPWMHAGAYIYPRRPGRFSLFPGHYYKFPIIQALLDSAFLTGCRIASLLPQRLGQTFC